jgi:hypothetical protein
LIFQDFFEFLLFALAGKISAFRFLQWCPFTGLCSGLIPFCSAGKVSQIEVVLCFSFRVFRWLRNAVPVRTFPFWNCSFSWFQFSCHSWDQLTHGSFTFETLCQYWLQSRLI